MVDFAPAAAQQEDSRLLRGRPGRPTDSTAGAGAPDRARTVIFPAALTGGPPLGAGLARLPGSVADGRAFLRRSPSARSGAPASRAHGTMPAPAQVIRREVTEKAAETALSTIMSEHERADWYKDNWPRGVKAITRPIAKAEDTTKDNLKSKLLSHPDVAAAVRPHRMSLAGGEGGAYREKAQGRRIAGLTGPALEDALTTVWRTYTSLLFYHVSKAAASIRESGLDPLFGGTDAGKAATDSLAARKQHNVAGSRNKVFVTRKWSEAQAYHSTGGEILRILIPRDLQAQLQVDPDSQYGLYLEGETRPFRGQQIPVTLLKGVDRLNRSLGPDAYYILTTAIEDPEIRDLLPELYKFLQDSGMFLPGREEEVLDLTQPEFRPITKSGAPEGENPEPVAM